MTHHGSDPSHPLSTAFLSQVPAGASSIPLDASVLESMLTDLLLRAHAAWPQCNVDDRDFMAHLGSRIADQPEAAHALQHVHVEDVYLAFACLQHNKHAVLALHQRVLPDARAAQNLLGATASFVEEVRQALLEVLFVGTGNSPPALRTYSGRGNLDNFLRATALRTASNIRRRTAKEVQVDDVVQQGDELERFVDVEMELIKEHYRSHFAAAFRDALAQLEARDRNVLRLSVVDGLNIDEIGTIYQVHRTTTARWLARIRKDLLVGTRRALAERLNIQGPELDSLLRVLQTRLDISVGRYLKDIGQET